jgi:hypothetical protein
MDLKTPLQRSVGLVPAAFRGALGFGLASLMVFGTVAYGERSMYQTLGLYGAYAAWTLLFIVPSAAALRSLVVDPARKRSFPVLFGAAFFLYAVGWMAGYFALRKNWGEQPAEGVASLLGSALLALTLAAGLRALPQFGRVFALLFAANTAGYFVGGALYFALGRPVGMLLWGVAYGLLLGAGLGAAIHLAQVPTLERAGVGVSR